MAAEAAEMLVRAARPTASSTFSGYRYVPAGDSGLAGWGGGRLDPSESGRWIRRGREKAGEGVSIARRERSTRGRCGTAVLTHRALRSVRVLPNFPRLWQCPPQGARLCTRARLCWYLQARAPVYLARCICVQRLSPCADSGWPLAPLRRPVVMRRNARMPVSEWIPTCPRAPKT